jgi:hypothetical protein
VPRALASSASSGGAVLLGGQYASLGWIHSPRSARAGRAWLCWLTVLTSLVSAFDLGLVNLLSNLADEEAALAEAAEADAATTALAHGDDARARFLRARRATPHPGGWDVTGGYVVDSWTWATPPPIVLVN